MEADGLYLFTAHLVSSSRFRKIFPILFFLTHLSAIQFDVSTQCDSCQGGGHHTSENGRDNEAN